MANRRQGQQKKGSNQFSIEMDVKGIVMLLGMALVSMALVFYLGMIYGKAQRNPAFDPGLASTEKNEALKPQGETITDLEVYDINKDDTGLGDLKRDFDSLSGKADQATQEEKARQEAMDQVITVEGADSQDSQAQTGSAQTGAVQDKEVVSPQGDNTTNLGESKQTSGWPDNSQKAAKSDEKLFTIQVLATRNKERAEAIITQLRKKGFDAYLTEVSVENTPIYRIRVGKQNKDDIAKTKEELTTAVRGLTSRLQIYQIK